MTDWQQGGFTWKGSVGAFGFGYVGPRQWEVRDKRSGAIVSVAKNLSEASQKAQRHWNAEREGQ
jgi:hypothetical protein